MEARDPKSTESNISQGTENKEPQPDATSSETLGEIEQTEKISETTESGNVEKSQEPAPSPDGAFDEGRGGSSGIDDAGPM